MWYVIQTISGREQLIKDLIDSGIAADCFQEIKIIYYETKRRYKGTWHVEQRQMFPGYLFAVTDDVMALKQQLRRIPELTKLLGYDGEIVPISKEETQLLKRLAGEGNTVEMSYGIKEGDLVTIQEGPLVGMESVIRRIDRHKRKAYIELPLLGSVRTIEIGLEVVGKKQ